MAFLELRKLDEALADTTKAMELQPRLATAHLYNAYVLVELGCAQGAAKLVERGMSKMGAAARLNSKLELNQVFQRYHQKAAGVLNRNAQMRAVAQLSTRDRVHRPGAPRPAAMVSPKAFDEKRLLWFLGDLTSVLVSLDPSVLKGPVDLCKMIRDRKSVKQCRDAVLFLEKRLHMPPAWEADRTIWERSMEEATGLQSLQLALHSLVTALGADSFESDFASFAERTRVAVMQVIGEGDAALSLVHGSAQRLASRLVGQCLLVSVPLPVLVLLDSYLDLKRQFDGDATEGSPAAAALAETETELSSWLDIGRVRHCSEPGMLRGCAFPPVNMGRRFLAAKATQRQEELAERLAGFLEPVSSAKNDAGFAYLPMFDVETGFSLWNLVPEELPPEHDAVPSQCRCAGDGSPEQRHGTSFAQEAEAWASLKPEDRASLARVAFSDLDEELNASVDSDNTPVGPFKKLFPELAVEWQHVALSRIQEYQDRLRRLVEGTNCGRSKNEVPGKGDENMHPDEAKLLALVGSTASEWRDLATKVDECASELAHSEMDHFVSNVFERGVEHCVGLDPMVCAMENAVQDTIFADTPVAFPEISLLVEQVHYTYPSTMTDAHGLIHQCDADGVPYSLARPLGALGRNASQTLQVDVAGETTVLRTSSGSLALSGPAMNDQARRCGALLLGVTEQAKRWGQQQKGGFMDPVESYQAERVSVLESAMSYQSSVLCKKVLDGVVSLCGLLDLANKQSEQANETDLASKTESFGALVIGVIKLCAKMQPCEGKAGELLEVLIDSPTKHNTFCQQLAQCEAKHVRLDQARKGVAHTVNENEQNGTNERPFPVTGGGRDILHSIRAQASKAGREAKTEESKRTKLEEAELQFSVVATQFAKGNLNIVKRLAEELLIASGVPCSGSSEEAPPSAWAKCAELIQQVVIQKNLPEHEAQAIMWKQDQFWEAQTSGAQVMEIGKEEARRIARTAEVLQNVFLSAEEAGQDLQNDMYWLMLRAKEVLSQSVASVSLDGGEAVVASAADNRSSKRNTEPNLGKAEKLLHEIVAKIARSLRWQRIGRTEQALAPDHLKNLQTHANLILMQREREFGKAVHRFAQEQANLLRTAHSRNQLLYSLVSRIVVRRLRDLAEESRKNRVALADLLQEEDMARSRKAKKKGAEVVELAENEQGAKKSELASDFANSQSSESSKTDEARQEPVQGFDAYDEPEIWTTVVHSKKAKTSSSVVAGGSRPSKKSTPEAKPKKAPQPKHKKMSEFKAKQTVGPKPEEPMLVAAATEIAAVAVVSGKDASNSMRREEKSKAAELAVQASVEQPALGSQGALEESTMDDVELASTVVDAAGNEDGDPSTELEGTNKVVHVPSTQQDNGEELQLDNVEQDSEEALDNQPPEQPQMQPQPTQQTQQVQEMQQQPMPSPVPQDQQQHAMPQPLPPVNPGFPHPQMMSPPMPRPPHQQPPPQMMPAFVQMMPLPPPPPPELQDVWRICRYHLDGSCRYGDSCRSVHMSASRLYDLTRMWVEKHQQFQQHQAAMPRPPPSFARGPMGPPAPPPPPQQPIYGHFPGSPPPLPGPPQVPFVQQPMPIPPPPAVSGVPLQLPVQDQATEQPATQDRQQPGQPAATQADVPLADDVG
ncbi:Centromere protein J [Durusdinium trenchii]|uniref:Centromere protein J n=1 Tax=Durusdinium trenchii TaxID=1381693 RepID=A0ABP0Q650_9DINO